MWFIVTFFIIILILQLFCVIGFFIALIEGIFKIEIIKESLKRCEASDTRRNG